MADDKIKPSIPAWQRAQQPQPEAATEVKKDEAPAGPESISEADQIAAVEPAAASSSPTEMSASAQLENMKTFLEDPSIKDASNDKKRAFFESKGISKDLIDEVLRASEDPAVKFSDFEAYRQQQQQRAMPKEPPAQQRHVGPPIITYPEFLVEAHRPPPLVTIGRIWNTAQIASGVAALIYGASKYLVSPMSDSLNEARHDFSLHSQGKLDEFNERIGKLVSKHPDHRRDKALDDNDNDTSSEFSDPTELYHRDIGTQTSPPQTPRPSPFGLGTANGDKKSPTEYQVTGLEIMKSHLDEMLDRSEKVETSNQERQDKMNSLRHYLDTIMYASPGISVWSSAEEVSKADGEGGKEDVIEELKKEIRGVKGVMLSAKRFPPGVANGAK